MQLAFPQLGAQRVPGKDTDWYFLISVIKISSQRKSNDDSLLNIFALFLFLYYLGGVDQMNIEYEIWMMNAPNLTCKC